MKGNASWASQTYPMVYRWLPNAAVLAMMLALLGCSAQSVDVPLEAAELADPGAIVSAGYVLSEVATGFDGPTQIAHGPDGSWVIAELNGSENAATGRVVQVMGGDPTSRIVLQAGLNKPTGVAVVGDALWIMERRRLSVASLTVGADLVSVADELPFNGRSEGSLTPDGAGGLIYNTSGSKRGSDRVEGSGVIFEITNASLTPSIPQKVAEGLKHAYAHTFDADRQLWATEMSDGSFDGAQAVDELVRVIKGDDFGWPRCVGDNRPVAEFGGTPGICQASPRSHALFGAGSTPTGLAVAPWDPDTLVVALWVDGTVVAIPRSVPEGEPWTAEVLIAGLDGPQSLLADGNRLLVLEFGTGRLLSLATT